MHPKLTIRALRLVAASRACVRIGAINALLVCGLTVAHAQVEVEVPGQGKVLTTTKVENGVLGVTNALTRPRGFGRDCSGACYYVSATKAKTWTCKGNTVCRIDCAGREPVGACPPNEAASQR